MSGIAIIIKNADYSGKGLGSVTPVVAVPVTAIDVSAMSTDIDPEDSELQLSLVFTPSNTTQRSVTWSSSNTSIATIDTTGKITVISRPSSDTVVVFTATSVSNSSVTDSISITVKSQQQTPVMLAFSGAVMDKNTSDQTKVLNVQEYANANGNNVRATLLVSGATEHIDSNLVEYKLNTNIPSTYSSVDEFKQALAAVGEPIVIKGVKSVTFSPDMTKLRAKNITGLSYGVIDIATKRLLNTWQWYTNSLTVNIENESDYSANKQYWVLTNFKCDSNYITSMPEIGVDFNIEFTK